MIDAAQEAMIEIAKSGLAGETDAIWTCWKLCRYQDEIRELLGERDSNTVVAVQSETDHLPVGELLNNWHPAFIEPKLA